MGTAIKHPVPDRIKSSLLKSGHSDAQGWASECPDVKNYKWRVNLVWHRLPYSSTHMATVGVKGLIVLPDGKQQVTERYRRLVWNRAEISGNAINTQQTRYCGIHNIHLRVAYCT